MLQKTYYNFQDHYKGEMFDGLTMSIEVADDNGNITPLSFEYLYVRFIFNDGEHVLGSDTGEISISQDKLSFTIKPQIINWRKDRYKYKMITESYAIDYTFGMQNNYFDGTWRIK
jgi:hypothetical protein